MTLRYHKLNCSRGLRQPGVVVRGIMLIQTTGVKRELLSKKVLVTQQGQYLLLLQLINADPVCERLKNDTAAILTPEIFYLCGHFLGGQETPS